MTADEKRETKAKQIARYLELKEQFDLLRAQALEMSEALSEAGRYLYGLSARQRPTKTANVEHLQLPDYHKLVSDLEAVESRLAPLEAILDELGFKPK